MNDDIARDSQTYRLAQAHKMIRLGLTERNADGDIVPTAALDEMDSPIEPDDVDFEAIRRQG